MALQSLAFVGVIGMAKSTAGIGPKGKAKVSSVMHEWGKGELNSGSPRGPVVKNQKQAVAIALSEARKTSRAGRNR
ncbi:MAG TPA: DUF6496 domain-containing protein [Chloroflexota bacterium]